MGPALLKKGLRSDGLVAGAVLGELVQSEEQAVSRGEGDAVTLRCSYNTRDSNVRLYWYRQYPNRSSQYILFRGARSLSGQGNTAGFAQDRFSPRLDYNTFVLNISALQRADTAVYFCALREHDKRGGYSDQLLFGTGTLLQVKASKCNHFHFSNSKKNNDGERTAPRLRRESFLVFALFRGFLSRFSRGRPPLALSTIIALGKMGQLLSCVNQHLSFGLQAPTAQSESGD